MSTNLDSLKGDPKYVLYKATAKSFKPDAQLGTRGPLIPEKQNYGASQLEQVVNLRPMTNISGNILTSGSFIDIPINGSIPCNYIDGLILQTTYSNTTGSSCRLAPSPLQINYIQILTPEGVPAQQTYGQYIYQTLISILDDESLRPMAPALNMDYYYGPGAAIPNGGTATYWCPIPENIFTQASIFMPAFIGKNWTFCVYFSTTAVESGSAPTLTDAQLLVFGHQLSASDYADRLVKHKKFGAVYKFSSWQTGYMTTLSMNASNIYNINLTGFNGPISDVYALIQLPYANGTSNARTFYPVSQLQLLDANGVSITGGVALTDAYFRELLFQKYFKAKVPYYLPIYYYSFADDPKVTIATANNTGSYNFGGQEQLQITTNAAGSNVVLTATPSGTPASGSFIIGLSFNGVTSWTAPQAYNATASTIQTAIQSLSCLPVDTTVTVSGPFTAAANITFSFAGPWLQYNLPITNLVVASQGAATGGGAAVTWTITSNTVGAPGHGANTGYFISVFGRSFNVLAVSPDGVTKVTSA